MPKFFSYCFVNLVTLFIQIAMNMKTIITLIFSLVAMFSAYAQKPALIYDGDSSDSPGTSAGIRKIRPQGVGKYVKVYYEDGRTEKIAKDSLWGYRDKKGNTFRMYRREPYLIISDNEIVTYAHRKMVGNGNGVVWQTYRLYSLTRNSPIVSRKKKLQI